jgi:hypothetical protein
LRLILFHPLKERITFSNPFVDHYNDLGNLETLGKNPVISHFPVTERYASYLLVDKNLIEEDLETFTVSDPVRIAL